MNPSISNRRDIVCRKKTFNIYYLTNKFCDKYRRWHHRLADTCVGGSP